MDNKSRRPWTAMLCKEQNKKSALRSTVTFNFVKKINSRIQPYSKTEKSWKFYANYQCENESTKQLLYSYKQSNIPSHSFFPNWIYLAQCETTHAFNY